MFSAIVKIVPPKAIYRKRLWTINKFRFRTFRFRFQLPSSLKVRKSKTHLLLYFGFLGRSGASQILLETMSEVKADAEERLIVFDTDAGVDDAWALLMLLRATQKDNHTKLLAVTCVKGNTKVDNVVRNVFKVLDAFGEPNIPVYKGASDSIIPFVDFENFHGSDGFGDVYAPEEDSKVFQRLQETHAVIAMNELACQFPKRITFISVGPLTNLALCLKMYPDFSEKVKELYIMGGNRRGIGNITTCAEFNFYADPEAAFIVMKEDKLMKTILPWETCLPQADRTTLEWRLEVISAANNRITQLMDPVDKKVYQKSATKSWSPCDAYLMACFLFPGLMTKRLLPYHVSVELTGTHTRGQMIVDYSRKKEENTRIIERIDVSNFRKIACWTVGLDVGI